MSELKEKLLGSMRSIATGLKTDLVEFRKKLRDEIAAMKSQLTVKMEQQIKAVNEEAARVELGKVQRIKSNLESREAIEKVKSPILIVQFRGQTIKSIGRRLQM